MALLQGSYPMNTLTLIHEPFNTHTTHENQPFGTDTHIAPRIQPLSPISPAESLESLPPDTPALLTHCDLVHIQEQSKGAVLSGSLWTSCYPSPPSTTSEPKHPVPLPSLGAQSMHPIPQLYDLYEEDEPEPREGAHQYNDSDGPRGWRSASTRVPPHHQVHSPNAQDLDSDMRNRTDASTAATTRGDRQHSTNPRFRMGAITPDLSPCNSPLLSLGSTAPPEFPCPDAPRFAASLDADLLSPISPEWDSKVLAPLKSQHTALPRSTELGAIKRRDDGCEVRGAHLEELDMEDWSQSLKPILPLLEIPRSSLGLRSYEPSPSSSLWLAEQYSPTPSESDEYAVSPPSSSSPQTPSSSSPLLAFLEDDFDLGDTESEDATYSSPPLLDLFSHPGSPSIRTLDLLEDEEPPHDCHDSYDPYDSTLLQSPSSIRFFSDLPETDSPPTTLFSPPLSPPTGLGLGLSSSISPPYSPPMLSRLGSPELEKAFLGVDPVAFVDAGVAGEDEVDGLVQVQRRASELGETKDVERGSVTKKAREVGALLRAKLREKGMELEDLVPVDASPKPRPSSRQASVNQVVAKMILSRREAPSSSPVPPPSRAMWLKDLSLPYQQRYTFLRSSPLARKSVSVSDEDANVVDGGDVGALFDEDEMDGGFDALSRPISWGFD